MTQLSLRAKYELNRLPEIRKDLIEEWQDKDKFKEKDELLAHLIAERRASIEGRLYLEAKQRGLKPSPDIEEFAKKELSENRKRATKLSQELSQKHTLSEKAALYCAKNVLRYKEIHGELPPEKHIKTMAEIAKIIDDKNRLPIPNTPNQHEMDYLSRREGDLYFRDMLGLGGKFPSWEEFQQIQMQAKTAFNSVSLQTKRELAYAGEDFIIR